MEQNLESYVRGASIHTHVCIPSGFASSELEIPLKGGETFQGAKHIELDIPYHVYGTLRSERGEMIYELRARVFVDEESIEQV